MANPVTVVIGAGDYIAAAIARRSAAEGCTVVATRRRNEDKLQALVGEIDTAGGIRHGILLDARRGN